MPTPTPARPNRAPRRPAGASARPSEPARSPHSPSPAPRPGVPSRASGPTRLTSGPSRPSAARPSPSPRTGSGSGRPPFRPQGGSGGVNRRPFQGGSRGPKAPRRALGESPSINPKKELVVTAHGGAPKLRFVPLGGLGEIGRNCSYYEYGDEIVIVDVGIQFPEDATPGIDYIIPNMSSIEPKKQNVRGLIITHGHYDHFAAIHYVIEKMGNPVIYASKFTKAMIEKRHEEFPMAPKLRFQIVTDGSKVRISEHLEAEFFAIEHSIPESLGFVLGTPVGNMVSFGDFRVDIDRDGIPHGLEVFEKLRDRGVHSLFLDSTRAEASGHNPSEQVVTDNIERLIAGAKGRIILATFSSLVDRLIEIIAMADRHKRKVAVMGRSMVTNMEIAKNLGYLKGVTNHIIKPEDINKYKDSDVLVITTGTQGEPNSGFMRMAAGEHRMLRLKQTDTIIFSSSVVPGNERGVQNLHDAISRQVDEMYHFRIADIHSGGHAHGGDMEIVLQIIQPKFIVPIHGYYFMRKSFQKIAEKVGMRRDQVILTDNGQINEISENSFVPTDEKVSTAYVIVDGSGIGDVEEVVLHDRVILSQEGMFEVILTLDKQTGRLVKAPDIISRGFIHLRENSTFIDEVRKRIRSIMERIPSGKKVEVDYVKTLIRDQIGQFIYQQTKRRPMLLTVVIEI